MISRARRIGASKLWLWPTISRTLARSAASIMRRHSSSVIAIANAIRTASELADAGVVDQMRDVIQAGRDR